MKIVKEDVTVDLFENKLLNKLTLVHWSVPPLLFIPVISYLISKHWALLSFESFINLCLGLFAWSFTEYFMHRFVFHYHPKSQIGQKFHYLFHGIHHHYPSDRWRLVMPPSVSLPLAYIFYLFFGSIISTLEALDLFFAGFLIGYLCYDMIHYATHHSSAKWRWLKVLKNHHLKHHFSDPKNKFGVSSKFWDQVFKTR